MTELADKRVLITGASSGIGAAAAVAFAEAGADVALLARGEEGLERIAARVRARGRRAVVVPVDVAERAALEAAVTRAEAALGGIDVLVPNAALTVYGPFRDVAADDFERAVRVTFLGAVDTVRAALPALERSRGAIVATGSLMSDLPLPLFSSYASPSMRCAASSGRCGSSCARSARRSRCRWCIRAPSTRRFGSRPRRRRVGSRAVRPRGTRPRRSPGRWSPWRSPGVRR